MDVPGYCGSFLGPNPYIFSKINLLYVGVSYYGSNTVHKDKV